MTDRDRRMRRGAPRAARLRLVARTELRSRTKATSSLPTKDGSSSSGGGGGDGVVVEVGAGVATAATACTVVASARAHPLRARCAALRRDGTHVKVALELNRVGDRGDELKLTELTEVFSS